VSDGASNHSVQLLPRAGSAAPLSHLLLPTLIVALAFALLTHDLAQPSLWVDELFSVQIAAQDSVAEVLTGVLEHERRPPLYHLLLHAWISAAGETEFTMRLVSCFFGLAVVAGTMRLGQWTGSHTTVALAGALIALSPSLILYSRMLRYYSLLAALGLLATLLFLRLLAAYQAGRRVHLLIGMYFVVTLALAYTDYGALAVPVVHTVHFLIGYPVSLRSRHRESALIAGLWAGLLALWLPWLFAARPWSGGAGTPSDLGASVVGLALKAAYPLWAFTAGETLFPWTLAGFAAVTISLAAMVRAIWVGYLSRTSEHKSPPRRSATGRHTSRGYGPAPSLDGVEPTARSTDRLPAEPYQRLRRGLPGLTVSVALAPVAVTAGLSSLVATDLPFVALPSRSMHALPFVVALMAAGLAPSPTGSFDNIGDIRWPRMWLPAVGLGALCLANLAALGSLYAGRSYLNPIYSLPARDIAQHVNSLMRPGDVIVADWDSAVPYYLKSMDESITLIETPPLEPALDQLRALQPPPPRVWVISLGRDRTRVVTAATDDLAAWLNATFPVSLEWGYGEQDATYRRIKEALLHRPAYRYRATVTLYYVR
jgi:4-amino-4-deoxy-L-arabinose transferase-like glycosyltransferase